MTQPNTERQALRRKSAIQSAVFSTVVQLTATALLFWAHRNTDSAVVSAVLLGRMVDEANALGADAILNIRFGSSAVMQGAAEVIAYGTAVKLK